MEDEEYYHMMIDDLERLERVHHHTSHPSEHELLTRQMNQQPLHNPFVSGLRLALNNALKSGMEKLHVGRRGREDYWRKRGSWSSRGSGDS
ncbi:hypothetical protein QBC44DRAFT_11599 [Cladorrhinum sp. PSN332]|nr:hypothetical protein QBC44DRAFT_11599 [Cladorrhinum sp. PSN332]